jgi:hypothetical protein
MKNGYLEEILQIYISYFLNIGRYVITVKGGWIVSMRNPPNSTWIHK